MNAMPPNRSAIREATEPRRHDKNGSLLPTPMRCGWCEDDANYGLAGDWYCTKHWQAFDGAGAKEAK